MKNIITKITATIIVLSCLYCCTHKNLPVSLGTWRGEFDTAGVSFPFHFILDKRNDSLHFTLINGGEKIQAQYVRYDSDSLIIKFPIYESVITAMVTSNGDTLKGEWIKTVYDKMRKVPFKAAYGNAPLFSAKAHTNENINGNFPTLFTDSSMAIGVFKQDSSAVSGTFLEPTGDERYLSGIINNDSLYLVGFDGTSADLFKAKIYSGDTMRGTVYYGNGDHLQFISIKNDTMPLPELQSTFKNKKLSFTVPNTNGKMISLSDARYKNKVVIIDIMGSWCHNCLDETAYLVDFYKRYHNKGVEIIGLSFERTHDRQKAMSNIKNFMQHFNVPYEILYAGTTQKDSVKKALPQVDEIYGYPTTIILNRKGDIAKTETGFSGPATGQYYDRFKKDFESYIDSLLESK